jgi:hypothetical protein
MISTLQTFTITENTKIKFPTGIKDAKSNKLYSTLLTPSRNACILTGT